MNTPQKQQRPRFGQRFVEQGYRILADDLRPKPPAPAPQAAPQAEAEVSADDLAALVGTPNGA
jgi:hypothetical protein